MHPPTREISSVADPPEIKRKTLCHGLIFAPSLRLTLSLLKQLDILDKNLPTNKMTIPIFQRISKNRMRACLHGYTQEHTCVPVRPEILIKEKLHDWSSTLTSTLSVIMYKTIICSANQNTYSRYPTRKTSKKEN